MSCHSRRGSPRAGLRLPDRAAGLTVVSERDFDCQRVEAPSREDKTQHDGGLRIFERRRAQGDAERFVVCDGPGFAGSASRMTSTSTT